MANIPIIVDNPYDGTKTAIFVPDDMVAHQLAAALANHFEISFQNVVGTPHHYRLVRSHDEYILRDTDKLSKIGPSVNKMFILLLDEEVTEYLREARRDQLFHIPSFWEFLFGLMLGSFFIVFSFPKGVTNMGKQLGWSWIQSAGILAAATFDNFFGADGSVRQATAFNNLWLGIALALALYTVVLASLSLRHQRFDLFGLGSLFLFLGTAYIQLLAWLLYLIGWFFYILFFLIGWILRIVGYIFTFIGSIVASLVGGVRWFFVTIFSFLFGSGWWLFALLLVIIAIYCAVKYRSRFFKAVLWILGISGITVLIIGAGYLLIKLLQFLAPFFAFIGRILGTFFLFLFSLFIVLYGCGALLMDQFKGAWKAGNGKRGVIMGALSIGTSLALALLETNLGNFLNFPFVLPPVTGLLTFITTFVHDSMPLFDMLITLLVVGVSIVGVLRNFAKIQRGPGWREFNSAIVIATPLAIMAGILLIMAQGLTHDNN